MTPERRARLEAAGHKVQSAADFFGLDEVDGKVVAVRLEVARLIRTLRAEQGVTQRDLAARMEVSQARIVGIEQGKNASLDAMLTAYLALGGQAPDFGAIPRRRLVKRRPTCLGPRRLRPPVASRHATRAKFVPIRPAASPGRHPTDRAMTRSAEKPATVQTTVSNATDFPPATDFSPLPTEKDELAHLRGAEKGTDYEGKNVW